MNLIIQLIHRHIRQGLTAEGHIVTHPEEVGHVLADGLAQNLPNFVHGFENFRILVVLLGFFPQAVQAGGQGLDPVGILFDHIVIDGSLGLSGNIVDAVGWWNAFPAQRSPLPDRPVPPERPHGHRNMRIPGQCA